MVIGERNDDRVGEKEAPNMRRANEKLFWKEPLGEHVQVEAIGRAPEREGLPVHLECGPILGRR